MGYIAPAGHEHRIGLWAPEKKKYRDPCSWASTLRAAWEGRLPTGTSLLSQHLLSGEQIWRHKGAQGGSVAGINGKLPCTMHALVWDIDNSEYKTEVALGQARKLVDLIAREWLGWETDLGRLSRNFTVNLSGRRGCHIRFHLHSSNIPDLSLDNPILHKSITGQMADRCGFERDSTIYETGSICRLPNQRSEKANNPFATPITLVELMFHDLESLLPLVQAPRGLPWLVDPLPSEGYRKALAKSCELLETSRRIAAEERIAKAMRAKMKTKAGNLEYIAQIGAGVSPKIPVASPGVVGVKSSVGKAVPGTDAFFAERNAFWAEIRDLIGAGDAREVIVNKMLKRSRMHKIGSQDFYSKLDSLIKYQHPIRPSDCRMDDDQWIQYCNNLKLQSPKDWCRICGREVRDCEFMRYGFVDRRCSQCR
jgi:hypothetical protein